MIKITIHFKKTQTGQINTVALVVVIMIKITTIIIRGAI